MQLAIEQAMEAEAAGEIPVGAVVVRDNVVVGVGRNRTIEAGDPTAHAEIVAIRAAARKVGNHRLDGLSLYVTLEPCPMCSGAIFHSRFSRLIYGAHDPKTGCAGSVTNLFENSTLNHHTEVSSGVLIEQCSEQLRSFFQKLRVVKYAGKQRLREDAVRPSEEELLKSREILGGGRFWMSSENWRVHYYDFGESDAKEAIFCLHDFPYWSYQFSYFFERAVRLGYRIISPDLLGCGWSDKPKKSDWHTLENHARVIAEFISSLGVGPIRFVCSDRNIGLIGAIRGMLDIECPESIILGRKNSPRSGFLKEIFDRSIWSGPSADYLSGLDDVSFRAITAPFPNAGHSAILNGMNHHSFTGVAASKHSVPKGCYYLDFSGAEIDAFIKR